MTPPIPEHLLEQVLSRSPDAPDWSVLEDWVLEHGGAAQPVLAKVEGVQPYARSRAGLVSALALRPAGERPIAPLDLAPLLRAPSAVALTRVRVAAPNVPFRARRASTQALVAAALASAPPRLRSLELWFPDEAPLDVLEPLRHQRPSTAQHLLLNVQRGGLFDVLDDVYARGWSTLTVRAPLTTDDLTRLASLQRRHPEVALALDLQPTEEEAISRSFGLVQRRHSHLVTLDGERTLLEQDAPPELSVTQRLWQVDLELLTDFGTFTLQRASPGGALLLVDGVALEAPRVLQAGTPMRIERHEPMTGFQAGAPGSRERVGFNIRTLDLLIRAIGPQRTRP